MAMAMRPIRLTFRRCLNVPYQSLRSYATALEEINFSPAPPPQIPTDSKSSTGKSKIPELRAEDAVLKKHKPITPGRRHYVSLVNDHLWKGKPHKPLTYAKKGQGKAGRNNTGRITVRHRGGGHARRVRTVDFFRTAPGKQDVERIEYDPNRSAHIALLIHQETKEKSYIVAADGLRAGDVVESYRQGLSSELKQQVGDTYDPGLIAASTVKRGNCLPLHMVPIGTSVFNVGLYKNDKAKLCRSAGTYATVVAKDAGPNSRLAGKYVTVKLQSGESRKVSSEACATVGVSSNIHYHLRQLGKAGRSRWLGIRPTVRGVAMNTCDHPHGGGRGKSKSNRIPTSPWGIPSKGGFKTRSKSRSNNHVVVARPRNQGKRRAKSKK